MKRIIPWMSAFLIMGMLLVFWWRNPFSTRTLIANLEPFPDSFHYLIPPFRWAQGQGWQLERFSSSPHVNPSVPPLYSFAVLPAYLLVPDIRMFYFVNVLLWCGTFFLIGLTFRQLKTPWYWQFLAFLLLAGNWYTRWLPSLAMAENLLILWFAGAMWLLTHPTKSRWWMAASAVLPSALMFTKYASLPSGVVLGLAFFVLAWQKKKLEGIKEYLAWAVGFFIWGNALQTFSTHSSFLHSVWARISPLFITAPSLVQDSGIANPTVGNLTGWFSFSYLPDHAFRYALALFGKPEIFLWDTRPWWPGWVVMVFLGGLFFLLRDKSHRFLWMSLLAIVGSQVLFMSTFYAMDMRYLAVWYLLIPVGIASTSSVIPTKGRVLWNGVSVLLLVFWMITNASAWRFQAALNLKYAETPWYWQSVEVVDAAISSQSTGDPVVISAVSPFLFDAYSSEHPELLPLSPVQDFFGSAKNMWGNHEYSDLFALYDSYLAQKRPVYFASYGLGNVAALRMAAEKLQEHYDLTLIQEGCYQQCNVYQLHSKTMKL